MHTTLRRVVLCLVAASACSESARTSSPAPPSAPPEPEPGLVASPETKPHMAEHFIQAVVLRDAVVAGDYLATRVPARWLAEHGAPADVPDSWIEHVTAMKVIAGAAHDARDLDGVAAAVGQIGHACASCHQDLGATIDLAAVPEPATGADARGHMLRHQWAADRMWEGLFVPSDDSWKRGAAAFYEAPLHGPETAADHPQTALARRAHLIGKAAMTEVDPLERAKRYGELLGTCAACHRASP